jgi:hypothetical protein
MQPDSFLFRNDPYKGSDSFWITTNVRSFYVMNCAQGMIFLGVIVMSASACFVESRSK